MVARRVRLPPALQKEKETEVIMQAVEMYKGYVAISARWLIENGIITKVNYDQLCHRHHIRVVRRGCKGTPALVDWQSMPQEIKRRIEGIIGNPNDVAKQECMLRNIVEHRRANCKDIEAWDYFASVRGADGRMLEREKVEKLTNSARILAAIGECLDLIKQAATMRKQRFSVLREFERFAYNVAYEMSDYPSTLPTNADRLYRRWKDYSVYGYSCLVHGLTGKEGNRKRDNKEEIEALVSELVASGAKLSDTMVAKLSATLGVEIDRRRVQEVRKKNEVVNMAGREGKRKVMNNAMMQVDRIKPSQPMLMWCSDGWDAELYYQDERSRYNRLNMVVVVDTFNCYPMGYAIGERECGQLISEAYRDAINHAELLFGEAVMPHQIQSDNYAVKMMTPYYSAICREFTPAKVGNAKDKVIEQYFRSIQTNLQLLPNYSGHNITAKTQPNDDWLNAHAKDFPTREGVIRQLEALISIERANKREELMKAWDERDTSKVELLDRCKYLAQFGEKSRGNMLTPNGIKLIREGVEYKFECRDIRMREQRGERWTICFDLRNMNYAAAVSEDGRTMYQLEAKKKVHMALADRTEEDERILAGYGEFNSRLIKHIGEERAKRQEIARGYIERHQLSGTYAARLLTENGNHKDLAWAERKRLAEAAEAEEVEEVVVVQSKKESKRREQVRDIYNSL